MQACLILFINIVMATIFSRIIAGEIPCYKVAENDKFFAEETVVGDVHFDGLPFTAQILGKIGCVFLEFLALVINQSAVSAGIDRGTNCYRGSDLR